MGKSKLFGAVMMAGALAMNGCVKDGGRNVGGKDVGADAFNGVTFDNSLDAGRDDVDSCDCGNVLSVDTMCVLYHGKVFGVLSDGGVDNLCADAGDICDGGVVNFVCAEGGSDAGVDADADVKDVVVDADADVKDAVGDANADVKDAGSDVRVGLDAGMKVLDAGAKPKKVKKVKKAPKVLPDAGVDSGKVTTKSLTTPLDGGNGRNCVQSRKVLEKQIESIGNSMP